MTRANGVMRGRDKASLPEEFDRRTVRTSVGEIEVAIAGSAKGLPLVLTSHGMGCRETFTEIASHLSRALRNRLVVTWSRPGCGNTDAALPEDMDALSHEAALILPALLDALGIEKADFAGHDDGASINLMFAALHPERVGRLAAIAPHVFADAIFDAITAELPPDEVAAGFAKRLGARHSDAQTRYQTWLDTRRQQSANGWSIVHKLPLVRAPLLLIQGLEDEFVSSDQLAAIADEAKGPVEWVVLRNQGHFPQHDNPEQVLRILERFFAGAEPHAADARKHARAGDHFSFAGRDLPPFAATADLRDRLS